LVLWIVPIIHSLIVHSSITQNLWSLEVVICFKVHLLKRNLNQNLNLQNNVLIPSVLDLACSTGIVLTDLDIRLDQPAHCCACKGMKPLLLPEGTKKEG